MWLTGDLGTCWRPLGHYRSSRLPSPPPPLHQNTRELQAPFLSLPQTLPMDYTWIPVETKFRCCKLSLVTKITLNCSQFEHPCSFFRESLCFRQSFSTSFCTTRVYIIAPNCLQADSLSGALTTLLPKGQQN